MQADGHHAAAQNCFFIQLVKFIIELLFKGWRAKVVALELYNVVEVDGVRHNNEVLAFHWNDERFIRAHIINVISETLLLQKFQRAFGSTHGRAVVSSGCYARNAFDDLDIIRDKFALGCFVKIVLWRPCLAVRCGFMTALHDLPRQCRGLLNGDTYHMRSGLDFQRTEKIKQTRHAFAHPILIPRGCGEIAKPWLQLKAIERTGCTSVRLATSFELHRY